jgi:hypothetical protein
VVETDMSNFIKTEAGRELTLGMQALKRVAQRRTSPGGGLPGLRRCALDHRRHRPGRRRLQALRLSARS